MRIIQKTDEIFHYLTIDEARSRENYNDFACFRWDGANWLAFYMYADNYYNAAFQLLEDAKNNWYCDNYQPCQNIDSIIYPICFLYRHFVELTLKWLFIKHASIDDAGRTNYIEHANHDLIQCWLDLRPVLKEKLSKVQCDCDIDAIEHYIQEWNRFDPDSFKMRYPCTKEEVSSSLEGLKLDVVTLKEKMESFCDSIHYVDGQIESIMCDSGPREQNSRFWNMYKAMKDKIVSFVARLEQSDEQKEIPHPWISYISSNEAEECIHSFYKDLSSDDKIVVETIYMVSSLSSNWPKGKYSAQQAFLNACVTRMQKEGFKFGETVDETNISFHHRNKRVLLSSLNKALSILEKEVM